MAGWWRDGTDFDLLIQGGYVVDGTGNPWVKGDVGVRRDRIAEVGDLGRRRAGKVIFAGSKVVCPGFIDIHSHSEFALLVSGKAESKVRQGVTTELVGNCGLSPAPRVGGAREFLERHAGFLASLIEWNWETTADYLRELERKGISINVATLAGHRTLRAAVMGFEHRQPAPAEMERMKDLLRRALEEGAFGLSSGLAYVPGAYADAGELVELCKVVAGYRGFYASHIRDDGAQLMEAIREAIQVSSESGEPVQISHHKGLGKHHRGPADDTLKLITERRATGHVDVSFDVYPYVASSTWLSAYLPMWLFEGGVEMLLTRLRDGRVRERAKREMSARVFAGDKRPEDVWNSMIIAHLQSDANKDCEGKTLAEIARMRGSDPFEAMFDLLVEEEAAVSVVVFELDEENLTKVMKDPLAAIGSDGYALACDGALARGKPHPRSFGTFPRVLGRYVRELGVLSLEDAVRKMTSLPAQRLGLKNRGMVREGMFADIVVFDPDRVRDTATYAEPHAYPVGIEYVLVNGVPVVWEGNHTAAFPGRVLRLADRAG